MSLENLTDSSDSRKHSDGHWKACYTTGIDPKQEKQIQKSAFWQGSGFAADQTNAMLAFFKMSRFQTHFS